MNYDRYYTCDLVNGEGVRVTLFVTGCQHACLDCHNASIWDRKTGRFFSDEVREQLLSHCATHDGLSLSGGDPLHPANREAVLDLCQAFKARYPEKNIWLWTGYRYDEVASWPGMRLVDVVIDGKYERGQPTTLPWRGSANQRLIRLKGGSPVSGIV
ncbi:anaerobic ribonucleoside-triphosphate reductase activating protein [Chromobacterium sp. IIBBL 290-4]|uniref:anaerobic ribonucleoside-triphosphate reductase activating protein n=1 Tax=Chromobacterium sp. IIBBL 290-4 TaxID=2953890 RepID=UPI0020B65140|nr:anaerobic ribonucleoside-triphosphate reductase activating protein [Chromobacterium sp. IIBBL 290-4]UTH73611.1 anaerobic ribonucleoside-triphosphate reductase activating protein [Chromobacterium sp. IIBBL 290-4]